MKSIINFLLVDPTRFRKVEAPPTAVGAELGCIEASSLQHHSDLVSGAPTLRVLLGCRHHSLQPPGLPPFVDSYHMDAQLLENAGHALPVRRGAHPSSRVSLNRLAVTDVDRSRGPPQVASSMATWTRS